jgi:CRP/FNR family transcriptional regulator
MTNTPHEVTAETMQPSQLAFIRRDDFLAFLKEHGDACLQAATLLSRECQSAYDSIRSMGLSHSVTEKLARLIQQWTVGCKPVGGVIRTKITLTHEEISQLSGTTRETVTRVLGELKRKGVAELKGSTLLVRNPAALDNLAGN